ncbi:polysaccharide deacetylase family protein [Ureibacillus sp. Re31]|uniref:Polysaccharide deacetylase family protein n=1 Tax=Ureibacillus galli TaxID=2762222 RepID=A0ABR8XBZ8_9BACL|nr:polysaccharide deacetylase family protein [Ureibacillus galli]MBD8026761.1 polysaccharide deacetylase family protein [Ureibacillus galli]
MKAKRIIIFVLSIFVFLGAILLFKSLLVKNDGSDTSNEKNSSKKTEASAYSGVNIVSEVFDETTFHIAIHYPKFKDEQLNQGIADYVSESKQNFLNEVKNNKEFLKENIAELNISFNIYPVIDNVYSIVFSNESYVVGANGTQSTKVFLVDIHNNQYIQQTAILNDNEQNRDKIYELLRNAFEQSEQYSLYFFKEDLKNWIEDEDNHFSNMYLTDKSVVFKFNEYEVTAGAAGTPEISIPFDQFKEFLTDEWKNKLAVEVEPDHQTVPPKVNNGEDSEKPSDKGASTGGKRVALTFDDGPHPKNTEKILKLLDKYNAKATFFMLGNRVDFYPNIVKDIASKGHELGNHTWSHKDLTTLSNDEVKKEVKQTNEAILKAVGEYPTVFRPPYGAINDRVDEVSGMPATLWTIDTLDWKSHDPKAILSIVKENVKDGSVILMHDIHATTVEALEPVLKFLKEEGYECVTVSNI